MEDGGRTFTSTWIRERLEADSENPILVLWNELLTDDDVGEAMLLKRVRELYAKAADG